MLWYVLWIHVFLCPWDSQTSMESQYPGQILPPYLHFKCFFKSKFLSFIAWRGEKYGDSTLWKWRMNRHSKVLATFPSYLLCHYFLVPGFIAHTGKNKNSPRDHIKGYCKSSIHLTEWPLQYLLKSNNKGMKVKAHLFHSDVYWRCILSLEISHRMIFSSFTDLSNLLIKTSELMGHPGAVLFRS